MTPISYTHADTPLTGYLTKPASTPRAAIVIFPTIANCTPGITRRAQMLADAGYLALIADFYGENPDGFESAKPLATNLRADPQYYRARITAALAALQSLPESAGLPIATIGYCMGGQAALELARSGADLLAAVSFHGNLDTKLPAQPDAIKAQILVCHGDADPMVPREQVQNFWQEMDVAGANWHFHAYSGVKHGFTDPASDARGLAAVAYNASADRQSWAAMMGLFDELFTP